MRGVDTRMGRLFGPEGKAVVVACDHGMFDGPHAGMVDIPAMLERVGDGPDAILLSPGMLGHASAYFGRRAAPPAIVRLNYNSVFSFAWNYSEAEISHLFQPEDAVAAGAEAVLVCLTLKTGSEARDAHNAEVFVSLCNRAHEFGLPVVGEYFPLRHLEADPDAFHDEVLIGCRALAEFGADAIKTFYTKSFAEVTAACPIPVLGLGAEKTPTDLEALQLAERQVRDGAGGVVFGRNVVQASNPAGFVAALHAVVKQGQTAVEAAREQGLTA